MTSSPDLINRTEHCEVAYCDCVELGNLRKELSRVQAALRAAAEREASLVKRCNEFLMRETTAQAHWIYAPCDGVWTTTCSHCGYEETGYYVMHKYKGCPMCRAKMTHIDANGHKFPIAERK